MKWTAQKTMKAIAIDRFGGRETLTLRTLPVPEVRPDENRHFGKLPERKTTLSVTDTLRQHKIVSPKEWLAARKVLLAKEKELRHLRDQLAEERRALPWVRIRRAAVRTCKPRSRPGTPFGRILPGRWCVILFRKLGKEQAVEAEACDCGTAPARDVGHAWGVLHQQEESLQAL